MNLRDYLARHRFNANQFAIYCKLSHQVIMRALRNEVISSKSSKIIFKKTGGLVNYKKTRNYNL